ncbi:MAG: transposase [Cenarchaeum sp. SB0678_bin_8]|nr:transposase [Cenarchaeum sp. SB0666_bin_15]MYD58323.1 transposase [Cenarchaeum sp. SB0678_bin_8]MYJ28359.1 transposase [Cenarchaeum sp. SB0672_bin_9]
MDKQSSTRHDSKKPGGDLSLEEMFEIFPDEDTAREWFEGNIWPDGRRCPRCGYKYTCIAKHLEMPYFCCECKRYFSVKIGTVMEHSKISYRRWAVTTYLLATRPKRISSVQLGRDLGIKQSSAWLLLHKLRESWCTIAGPDLLSGPVETYPDGREKNKHTNKKRRRKKTTVVGITDR